MGGVVLVLDAASSGGMAALVRDGTVLAQRRLEAAHGVAAALPGFVAELTANGLPDLVAVTVGPGSFTGIRAALSLAHGLACAGAVPIVGVTVPEAIAREPGPDGSTPEQRARAEDRRLVVALRSRHGRVFLDTGAGPRLHPLDALPRPDGPVLLAGDAAATVAELFLDAAVAPVERPGALGVAAAATQRRAGTLPPLPPQPLYAEAPEARTAIPRPAPA